MLKLPKKENYPIGHIMPGFSKPGSNWYECDGSVYLKSSFSSYVNSSVDLHPLRWSQGKIVKHSSITYSKDVAVMGSTWVVINNTASISVSTDNGETWSEIVLFTGESYEITKAIGVSDTYFVIIIQSNTRCFRSSDGINWTQGDYSNIANNVADIFEIVWNGSIFLGVQERGANYITSSDGLNWTLRSFPDDFGGTTWYWNVAVGGVGGNEFVALRELYNTTYKSTDGINWTKGNLIHPIQGDQTIDTICYGNGVWVGFSFGGNLEADVHYSFLSYDGLNWEMIPNMNRSNKFLSIEDNSLIFTGDCFLIFGSALAHKSFDGIHWETIPNIVSQTSYSKANSNGSIAIHTTLSDYIGIHNFTEYDSSLYFQVPEICKGIPNGLNYYIRLI